MPKISKTAHVLGVADGVVVASVKADSACGHCSSRSSCFINNCSGYKQIEVEVDDVSKYDIGDKITVEIDENSAWKALFFAYVMPLMLLVTVVVGAILFGYGEMVAAVGGIVILIPYYIVLFLLREALGNKIKVKISTTDF